MKKNFLAMVAVGLLAGPMLTTTASAVPITYDFTVTGEDGPLVGVTSSGFFTYDDSIVVPGSTVAVIGLLTDLSFTWNSITYTAATANTGGLTFNALGELTRWLIGTSCNVIGCSLPLGNSWLSTPDFFRYKTPESATNFGGTTTFQLRTASVPEPGSLALLSLGLVALGAVTWTRRRKTYPLQFVA